MFLPKNAGDYHGQLWGSTLPSEGRPVILGPEMLKAAVYRQSG